MNALPDPPPMFRDWAAFQARQAAVLARYTPAPITVPGAPVAKIVRPSCCCCCACRDRED